MKTAEYQRRWRQENPEKSKLYTQKYYRLHLEKIKTQKREYYRLHAGKIKTQSREHYSARRVARLSYAKRWREVHRAKLASWREANRAALRTYNREYQRRRRAKIKAAAKG